MVVKSDDKMDTDVKGFDLLMNAAGDVMFAFEATAGEPENPLFIYDGRNKGILYKNKTDVIPFYPIPKEASPEMNKAKDILCVEVADEKIVAQYNAKVEVKK